MSKFEDDFENTMKSKDALDIAHALKIRCRWFCL
jgi:hypothetical protein